MMIVIKRWKVIYFFKETESSIILYVDDNYFSNVLTKLNQISFPNDPYSVVIEPLIYEQKEKK